MTRTLTLFTAVVLAISALTSAAPVDISSSSVASPIVNAVASNNNVTLQKRSKHPHRRHSHKKAKTSSKKKTTKKPTKKKTIIKKSSTSSSGTSYTGIGTWFIPSQEGGSGGACGPSEKDNAMIVALNAPQYGNMNRKSSFCGKKISIRGPHGTATATINDACPECKHGSLDMTQPLFQKVVGNLNIGVGKITWHVI